jgi:hypothetical protein
LAEWIGEPWQQWKENEDIILAILQYKGPQGDAWDGTVSECFVVPKGGEEGSEHWHESLWGMKLGQIASSISCGMVSTFDPISRLQTRAGFGYQQEPAKREKTVRGGVCEEGQYMIAYCPIDLLTYPRTVHRYASSRRIHTCLPTNIPSLPLMYALYCALCLQNTTVHYYSTTF